MKRQLLLCTILRNQRHNVDCWLSQLVRLSALVRDEYEVTLVAYENDSTDGTGEWLYNTAMDARVRGLPFTIYTHSETLGTQQYGSVWDVARIKQLAAARNKCLDLAGPLERYSKIAYIEPDVSYDPEWTKELILARHPAAAGLPEPDAYSGWSLRTTAHPKESTYLYDCCATRQLAGHKSWDFAAAANGNWVAHSLVQTNLGGVNSNCLHSVWSTFNCFCVYSAQPFKRGPIELIKDGHTVGHHPEGLRWGHVNRRLDASGIRVEDGFLDADTSCLCEDLHERGHHGIYLNTNCLIRHS